MRNRLVTICLILLAAAVVLRADALPTTKPVLDDNLGVSELIAVLKEPAWGDRGVELYRKRQACARIVPGLAGVGAAVPALVRMLHDPRTAPLAVSALARIAPIATAELTEAAHDDSPAVRKAAVIALADAGAAAEPTLLDVSRNDPDRAVSQAAVYGLCAIGSPEASSAVVALLQDCGWQVQNDTIRAIKAWPLTDAVARELANLLSATTPQTDTLAAARLMADHAHTQQVMLVIGSTCRWGDGRAGEAMGLQVLLSYPPQPGEVDLALRCVNSPDPQSESFAFRLLERSGSAALPWLYSMACLADNRSIYQRGNMMAAYEHLCADLAQTLPSDPHQAEIAVEQLLQVVRDSSRSPAVKVAALGALPRFGRRALPAVGGAVDLMSEFRDTDWAVAAATFLTAMRPLEPATSPAFGSPADRAVVQAMEDFQSRPAGQAACEQYLIGAGPPPATVVDLLDSTQDAVRVAGIHIAAAEPTPQPAVGAALARRVGDHTAAVRTAALSLLDRWLTSDPDPSLAEAVASSRHALDQLAGDPTDPERERAAEVLSRLPDNSVGPAGAARHAEERPNPVWRRLASIRWRRLLAVIAEVGIVVLLVLIAIGSWVVRRVAHHTNAHLAGPPQVPCTRCQTHHPTEARFCRRCGLTLS